MFYRTLLLFSIYIFQFVHCFEESQNVFLTAPKSVPRIGRSNNKDNNDFEKFFLKASKSVPRIGRRNENPFLHYDENEKEYGQPNNYKYSSWSELADRFEHEPELFSNPHLLYELEKSMGDDQNSYEWNNIRKKRKIPEKINFKPTRHYM